MDAADHEPERGVFRVGGHVAQSRPALEHGILDGTNAPDLVMVIHDPQGVEAGAVGGFNYPRQGPADRGIAARPGERRYL